MYSKSISDDIKRVSKAFNVRIEEELGICFGFANMGAMAIFCNDLEHFETRITLIHELSKKLSQNPNFLCETQKFSTKKTTSLFPYYSSTIKFFSSENIEIEIDYQELQNFLLLLNVYQSPFAYPEFRNIAQYRIEYFLPEKLNGRDFSKICSWMGLYTKKEIGHYLRSLVSITTSAPAVLIVSGPISNRGAHAICLAYQPEEKKWHLLNSNKGVLSFLWDNPDERQKLIESIFSSFEYIQFGRLNTHLLITSNLILVDDLGKGFADISQSQAWRAIHEITLEKSRRVGIYTYAAEINDIDLIKQMINQNTRKDCDDRDIFGSTPLISAAANGHLELVRVLIEGGAKVVPVDTSNEVANTNGNSALSVAALHGHAEIVQALLNAGSFLNHVNKSQETPFILAIRGGNMQVVQFLMKATQEFEYYTAKVDINQYSATKRNAINLAISLGYLDIASLLIDAGVKLDENSMKEAILGGHCELVKNLIKKGVSPGVLIYDKFNSYSALMFATLQGDINIIKILIDEGAEIEYKNKLGETAANLANKTGNIEAENLLIQLSTDYKIKQTNSKTNKSEFFKNALLFSSDSSTSDLKDQKWKAVHSSKEV